MGKFYKALVDSFDESVSTATMGAVFSVAAVMGVISVSGILMKPYEARDVVTSIHQRILLEKEMRQPTTQAQHFYIIGQPVGYE